MGEYDGELDAAVAAERAVAVTDLQELSVVGDWPGRQVGFAQSWRARSVDVAGFEFLRKPHEPADGAEDQPEPPSGKPFDDLAKRLRRLLQLPVALLLNEHGPLSWRAPFFSYQREGIIALLRSDHMLLADEMGLGKTVQAIAALRILLRRRRAERALIVAPASVLDQWMRAISQWAPDLRCVAAVGSSSERNWRWKAAVHAVLVSYETLHADAATAADIDWDVVILDEAQKIKNPAAEISEICKSLTRRRSWALTGTPLENRLEDTASILDFVFDRPARAATVSQAITLLSLSQLRRKKADVLSELPPKIHTDLVIDLTEKQSAAYDRARHEGIVRLHGQADITLTHVFALVTRLKQICNFEPMSFSSSKMDDMRPRLEEIALSGNKALVFTQFVDETAGARRIVAGLGPLRPLLFTGSMDLRERDLVIRRFNEDSERPVLVLSLKAGGAGLNLQAASYVFHFDRWWNPAAEAQAEDRAHRIGQPSSVSVYRYVVRNTIEERILQLIEEKQQLFRTVVDDPSGSAPPQLTKEDLLSLVAE